MAETREECLKRWSESLDCLNDDIEGLESREAKATADMRERIRDLEARGKELEAKIDEASGSENAVWEEVQAVIDTLWDSLGAEVEDLKKKAG